LLSQMNLNNLLEVAQLLPVTLVMISSLISFRLFAKPPWSFNKPTGIRLARAFSYLGIKSTC
jgi:hypothetical protein